MDTTMNAKTASVCPHNSTAHDGTLLCHWANSPGARGTLDIFWLCISTLGLCVWNAVHPDVPRPKTSRWQVLGMRVWMLFVGLFMPEMLVLVALNQLRQACNLLVKIDRETGVPTQFPWWMYLVKSWRPKNRNVDSESWSKRWKKAMRRRMESLLRCLRVHSGSDSDRDDRVPALADVNAPPPPGAVDAHPHVSLKSSETSHQEQQAHTSLEIAVPDRSDSTYAREHRWTLTHSFYAVMGGFVDSDGHDIYQHYIHTREHEWHPGPERIDGVSFNVPTRRRLALLLGYLKRIPDSSVEDIEDRSKAGIVAKSLLVWQLLVFLASCFARRDQSLPLSLLEITTIAHSLCSIIAMVIWWYKPHSIGEATVIDRKGPLPSPSTVKWREVFSWSLVPGLIRAGFRWVVRCMRMDGDDIDLPKTIAIAAIAVLYGLPHLLGLSVHFPTFAEQLFWGIATFTVIGVPLVMCGFLWMSQCGMKDTVDLALLVLAIIIIFLYPIASMFLVGESVRQIFALPVESFREPQQTTYLPSFS